MLIENWKNRVKSLSIMMLIKKELYYLNDTGILYYFKIKICKGGFACKCKGITHILLLLDLKAAIKEVINPDRFWEI